MAKYYGKAGFDALNSPKSMLLGNPDQSRDVSLYFRKDIDKFLSLFS
jgi:aldehyde dehydrogenase (NAD+)